MVAKAFVVVKAKPLNNGRYEFSVFHDTIDLAKEEALRLSDLHKGDRFLVLQVVGCAEQERTPITYKEV